LRTEPVPGYFDACPVGCKAADVGVPQGAKAGYAADAKGELVGKIMVGDVFDGDVFWRQGPAIMP
jgi:hypothetical protein